jgi:hypothetical protein
LDHRLRTIRHYQSTSKKIQAKAGKYGIKALALMKKKDCCRQQLIT